MIGRAVIFMLAFGGLNAAWQGLDGSDLHRRVIDLGVVAPAAALCRTVTPDLAVHAAGNQLRGAGAALNIVNGCDGMETLFLLAAGFLVAPLSWRDRLLGLCAGIPIVYGLNMLRILALFYAFRSDAQLFDLLHGIVTPVLMVIGVAAYYFVWLRRNAGPAPQSPP